MTTSTPPGNKAPTVAETYTVTEPRKGDKPVSKRIPLPCITILVHGVNDVGEAYDAQERGLCQGLNARLDRAHELSQFARPDLRPAIYKLPPSTAAERKKEGVKGDPDAVYYRRAPDKATWSPVVPFYWGSRESEDHIKKDNWHGQWTDRYGNRLDKNGAKNGGPFANATNNLNALWGLGFSGEVAGSEKVASMASDPLHNLKKACPRAYMLLAAMRLAMLIKIIRNKKGYEHVAINLVCHSQGCLIALTAHALLAEKGGTKSADTIIMQDPPYSIEEPTLEYHDGITGGNQQTTQSRIKTLSNIIRYIYAQRSSSPSLADLEFPKKSGSAVAGPHWKPGAGARQWVVGEAHTFTERDNRGKVYLYFCPRDATVALMTVQGIGWQGVPDEIKTQQVRASPATHNWTHRSSHSVTSVTVPVLSMLGEGFRQRLFTSREVDGKPVLVGASPARTELRSAGGTWPLTEENSTTGNMSATVKQIERGATRQINGEELHPKIRAVLTAGEGNHAGKLGVSPIDAGIAISSGKDAIPTSVCRFRESRIGTRRGQMPLNAEEIHWLEDNLPGQRQGVKSDDDRLRLVSVDWADIDFFKCTYSTETANEARARWQNKVDDNSYHSAIPANPAHAAGVTAYDLSLGAPLPVSDEDRAYLDYLCAVADWRTDWESLNAEKGNLATVNLKVHARGDTDETKDLISATSLYYKKGSLPAAIGNGEKAVLEHPKLIVWHTIAERERGKTID